uniref:DUF4283 domain-containing protein n=1 Tax=Brassica oleracea TaxID=3712 RepID=A0A3P6B1H8_BRAOL|nr:unnamed protein product [Brassica oleracea]
MVVHAYHSNIIQDFVCKNQLSCSRMKHILPKIFITHGLKKIGEVQGTFSNVQIRGSNVCCTLFPSPWFCPNWVFLLHPNTEKCIRLDVARVLVEVDQNKPLVEKISFRDKDGTLQEVEVKFSWLPSHCNVCSFWGHRAVECTCKNVKKLKKTLITEETSQFADPPQACRKDVRSSNGGIVDIIHELEAITSISVPKDLSGNQDHTGEIVLAEVTTACREDLQGIKLSKPTTEAFHANVAGNQATDYGKGQNSGVEGRKTNVDTRKHNRDSMEGILVSPSRFSTLQDIVEEMEEIDDEGGEVGKDIEEGEILESKVGGKKIVTSQVSSRGRKLDNASSHKPSQPKVVRAKDQKLLVYRDHLKNLLVGIHDVFLFIEHVWIQHDMQASNPS